MLEPESSVEVAYALPDRQRVVRVPLREGMTAIDAVRAAALEREFPELGRRELALGIYGRRVEATQPLRDGDRVEVYRPLKFDPREARRQAARAARPPRRSRP
jgi:putative ubiquitin-RnfH superfamily antitoxin RatB of RatAB toxin-antitoxin module